MIEVVGNKMIIDGEKWKFKEKISEAICYYDKIVVVFKTKKEDGCDNVYCYNKKGKFLWRIKPVPREIGGTIKTSYVGVGVIGDACKVVDFYGRRFTVNMHDGNVISMDIVK